ncbi:MAG TPA: CoA transferase [Rugosimonospora sp.]|nr:CoA transferase [Rugosimonospora sp.]
MSLHHTYRGLRVLDLSENIAGPLACLVLADLGADVVKIERPGTGEATRSLPPRWGGESTVFLSVNRNKRSAAIDLTEPAGRRAALRIAAGCDVVVESFRPGTADRLGLGFTQLSQVRPDLIHCSVSAFGTGPLGHDRAGYDAIVQAFTGIMEMTGEPGGAPARAAPSIVDISTGLWAVTAIQAALARRLESPTAQHLEATLVDSAFFLMCHQVIGYLATGTFPGRLGSAAPSTAPYQVFRTADGTVMIAAGTDRLFERLCLVLGAPGLLTDRRFRTVTDRVRERGALAAAIEDRLAAGTTADWLARLDAAGVPAGPVHDLAAALAHPVTRERALIREAVPGAGATRVPGLKQLRLPIDTEGACGLREPPALGEHTAEILAEAGLSPAEIRQLVPHPQTEATVPSR